MRALSTRIELDNCSDLEVIVPTHVDPQLFREGYEHGMRSNQLTIFKASYRAGFREAKKALRELRRARGIIELPVRAKFSISNR